MNHSEFYRGVERATATLANRTELAPAAQAERVHAAMGDLLAATGPGPERACAQGCAHCCHFPVGVTFGEAHRLAAAVAADAATRRHFAQGVADTATRTWQQLVGAACPLLRAGECLVYADRPLPCRALASASAEACAQALQGAGPAPVDEVAFWRGLGAAQVLANANVPNGTRELRAAVTALLETPPDGQAAAFVAARAAPAE